ncbi:MAG TPA: glycosyltransferase [Solirubrobacteraceae bacterium]|jgi:glycosyltransferase involved in cell wall biosynthesis/predicted metal-dependent phosphoesterase TrpH|nr:glycosyltransferase [Solirubrobacteraceae bacterium]
MPTFSKADLHVHSTASQLSKLGVQRSLGLPECATPPGEVYALAKRRGMDFVTITDHDTISGVLEISHRPDVFISEELTVWFRGEPQAVHVLCLGITPEDHEWLQAHNADVELCAAYLHDGDITCALAHPFYAVEAPLTPRHRRRLAQLFPVWETRNGSRAKELNLPAFVYIETHGGTGIGGTDDHAGVDIGRTYTETPQAATPAEYLANIRHGDAWSRGEQGSAAKWAHAAMAIAVRALGLDEAGRFSDPRRVMAIVERVMREGEARRGKAAGDIGPNDARDLLGAWLRSIDLDVDAEQMLELLQADDFSHADLFRRARRAHEVRLAEVVQTVADSAAKGQLPDPGATALALWEAILPAVPYAPAAAFLGREKGKLVTREGERPRVAIVADGIGGMHGVTHTLEEIRVRGVPGYEVEVIGTDPQVDRRLSAAAEVDIPFYAGLKVGVPSLPAVVETLAEGRYDLVHLVAPGPAGVTAGLLAGVMDLPIIGSYHTELAAYAGLRSGAQHLEAVMDAALRAFYGHCRVVLSPSPASDERLAALGLPADRVLRWDRGVDIARFDPRKRVAGRFPGAFNVLYAGRLTREKGIDLLADAFLAAHARDARLHLVLAGGGPEEDRLRERLGEHATFLGWLEGDALAEAYASADAFLFASRTDTFGQVILEAQASGLPVVAVAEGGPLSLIADGDTGLLRPAVPVALADAVLALADSDLLRGRLSRGALAAVRGRTWEAALGRLAEGYRTVLAGARTEAARRIA